MKMKKIVCAMVSAALLVSMAAATAFAVESVPSKTGTDADAGKTEVSASGSVSSEGLQVEVKTTEDSSKEETQLKGEGVEKYLTAEAVDAAAKILGTEKNAVTVSEIKEINSAVSFLGTRTMLASGLMFSMRMALRSPTRLPETL